MSARSRNTGSASSSSKIDKGLVRAPSGSKLKIRRKAASEECSSASADQRSKPLKATHAYPKTKSCRYHAKPPGGYDNYEDEFADQDIRFIDVKKPGSGGKVSRKKTADEKDGRLSLAVGSRAGSAHSIGQVEGDHVTGRDITYKEILEKSQETDASKVYEIDLHAEQIGKISNMDKFVKLRVLDLSSNVIDKIDNLHANMDLRELKLYDNRISILENLNNLKELCHLQLQHNNIKTIGKNFSHLKKMKILRLDSNQLLKLEPAELAPCMMLTSLDVSNNMLDSLAAVNSLPNLEELNASGNRLRTVPDLGRCKKLQDVDVSSNRLTDVCGLKGMAKLTVLNLSHNNIMSLNTLGKLKSLQELYLSHNRITSVKSLPGLFPNLELLNIADNKIESWDSMCHVSNFASLVELSVAGNPVCIEGGEKPHYQSEIQAILPQLDVLDGALLKRPSARGAAPIMRPMSANSVVSARQVESQMNSLANEMSSFEASISDRFESLKTIFQHLPEEAPSSARSKLTTASGRPSSRCSNRSRLQEAKLFAEQHF